MRPLSSLARRTIVALAIALAASAAIGDTTDKRDSNSKPKPPKGVNLAQALQVDLSQPLTLDRAIQIALANQNQLGIAKTQLEAAKARTAQVRASYFPSVSPTYQYSSQKTTQSFNGVSETGTFESSVTQVGASLMIFDMGKREENMLLNRYNERSAQFNIYDTRQTIIANVATAYYSLLEQKELVRVAQSNVDRTKTTLDFTIESVGAGAAPKKDILQAQADYDNAQVQLMIAQNNVRLGQATLKNAMGILTAQPVTTPDAPVPVPETAPDGKSSADYLKQAFDSRPDLRRDTASIDANRHNVKIANIQAGFQIQADVSEGYRVDPNPGENRAFTTGFSYPLFDGGASRAAVRAAKATLEQSRRQVELTKQGIQLGVEQAYLQREEARARITATQSAVKAAQKNYEAAQEARKEGAVSGTLLDVIAAQNALVTAETNAVQAIYDFYTNDALLRRAIGANDPYPGGMKQ